MRHMVQITVAVMVASLLAGVTLSADGNHELRIRRNQLVILSAMPDCDAAPRIITIGGDNFGTAYVPHRTLNLIQLVVMSADDNEVVAYLPPSLCDAPGTYLLTVMRVEMKYRRWWLKLTNKDLGTLAVTIGTVGPTGPQGEQGIGHVGTSRAGSGALGAGRIMKIHRTGADSSRSHQRDQVLTRVVQDGIDLSAVRQRPRRRDQGGRREDRWRDGFIFGHNTPRSGTGRRPSVGVHD